MKRRRHGKMNRAPSGRRGSAILLTMAILSLLLIVAIFFTFDTIQSSRLSKNHKQSVQARLLQECGLNRALAILDDFGTTNHLAADHHREDHIFLNPSADDHVFTDGTGDWVGIRYFPMANMTTADAVQDELDSAYSVSLRTTDSRTSWQLTPLNLPGSGFDTATWDSVVVNGRAIGQFSYLILDETGKLDPGYLGTSAVSVKTSMDSINIVDAGLPAGYIVDSCLSYAHFALAANPAASDIGAIRETLFPGTLTDSDHFWFDMNSDSQCDANEIIDRMDVREIGAGSISDAQLYSYLLTCDSTSSDYTSSGLSLWMAGLAGTNDSTAIERQEIAAQLVANIHDYTDADNNPAIYLVKTDGTITTPSAEGLSNPLSDSISDTDYESAVLGVESRVVLSEIMWRVYADTETIDVPEDETEDTTVSIKIDLKCRVGNPMGTKLGNVEVKVDYQCFLSNDADPPFTTIVDESKTLTLSTTDDAVHYMQHSDYVEVHQEDNFILADSMVFEMAFQITGITVSQDGVVTQRFPTYLVPGKDEDVFAGWLPGAPSAALNSDSQNVGFAASVYAKDPLMAPASPSVASSYWVMSSTVYPSATANSNFSPNSNVVYDDEPYCDAECTNTPITSLAELGRIHSPHTLNRSIKLWSRTAGEWHDAHLLDLFSTNTSSRRTVNINTRSDKVIGALISGILDVPKRQSIRDQWLLQNGTNAGNPLMFRSDAQGFFNGIGIDEKDDQEAEEALCSFIELLNTRQNYYTVISCARAIEDIGTSPDPDHNRCVEIGKTSGGQKRYGIVKGTYKTISAIYRDAWGIEKPRILRTTVVED